MTDKPHIDAEAGTVDGKPMVLMEPKRMLCPCHGEHLRAQWPKGYAQLAVTLFQAALAEHDLIRALGLNPDDTDLELPIDKLNELTATKPLCYFIPREKLRDLLLATGIYTTQRCDICGLIRDAGDYSVTEIRGVTTRTLCVECALNAGDRMHASFPDGGCWPT